jgi:hypothetical protein
MRIGSDEMGAKLPRSIVVMTVVALGLGIAQASTAAPMLPQRTVASIATLITGERVVLGTDRHGMPTTQIVTAANDGPASQDKVVNLNGDTYVIPASAMAYVGRFLDPGLFDATVLAAAGYGERMPLAITYEPGTSPSLPGVTITSASGGSAQGYVTPSGARVFGAALAEKAISDASAGWPSSDSLFGSVTNIAPIVPGTTTVIPNFPQTTLIIDGISNTGGPMRFGFGVVFNMEDGRKFAGFVIMFRGEARASVPLGTYAAVFDDLNFSTDGSLTVREDVVTDFAVTGTQPPMIVDSRAATAIPSITTPLPSVPRELSTDVTMRDETRHYTFGWGWSLGLPGASIRFTPQPVPEVGTLSSSTHWITLDPSTPGGSYDFEAIFLAKGIPEDQSEVLGPVSTAATVDNTYDAESLLQIGSATRLIFVPGLNFASATYWPIPMPLHRVDYVYAPRGSTIIDLALANYFAWDPGFVEGPYHRFRAGSSSTQHWFRNPYSLSVPQSGPDARFFACLACTSDTRLAFFLALHDSDPTHVAWVFRAPNGKPIARFRVYRNGELLSDKPDRLGGIFKIPTGPATYRIASTLSRRYTFSSLSTRVTTSVTFHSWQGVSAPDNFYCYTRDPCSIMPVPTEALDLHATTRGTLPVGTHVFDVQVGHIQGAADFAIVAVDVDIRRTGTHTWKPLAITSADGGYQAHFKAMAWMENRGFDVRVSVTDAKGNALVQTTRRAFIVGA